VIKLHGLRFSNYTSLVKSLLIEKGLDFEEVLAPPSQDEAYLVRSPMGKMPSLEFDDGRYLSESLAIFHYLEALHPEPALLPGDPFEAAKAMELACHVKLDVELVARRFLPQVLFNKPVSDETKKEVRRDLKKGMRAVDSLLVCDPHAVGKEFSVADMFVFWSFRAATGMTKAVIEVDLLDGHPALAELLGRLAERPSIARVIEEASH